MIIGFPKPIRKKKIRKAIRRVGKIGKRNIEANKELKKIYTPLTHLPPCEIGKVGLCWHMFMGFAHRHSRVSYRKYPNMLSSINQTLKSCNPCHQFLDSNSQFKKEAFLKLRGEDLLPMQYEEE